MSATFDFGMIVFNAEFLLGPCIKHVYEFAHRILIVEGATKATTHTWDGDTQWITSDGHSTDGTVELVKSFPDPDKKIVFIQRDGFWDGKTEMCNAYVPYIEADYVWQLDADEFYRHRDLLAIRDCLTTRPEITAVHFFANHFWGDWNHVACGRSPKVTEGYWGNDIPWQRVFKHEEGSRWASHEPPVYLDGHGVDQNRKRLLSRHDTRAMGIALYHYSYVTREQADFKSRFFGNPRKLADWDAWQTDHSRGVVVPGTFACEFKGEHPDVIREFISQYESGETCPCADVPCVAAAQAAPAPACSGSGDCLGPECSERDTTEGFDDCIARLACELFGGIDGQSSDEDRKAWLALQRAVRDSKSQFVYLEIGSYLGGSLQQYMLDPRCSRVFSIDKRPVVTPDARGEALHYWDNSVQRMREGLSAVAPTQLDKLVCFDSDACDVARALIGDAPDLCFIDGEHTAGAVVNDFLFCLSVCAPDAVVYFHDESLIRPAIRECLQFLKRSNRPCVAYKLPGDTFAIALAGSPVIMDPRISRMASNGKRWIASVEFSNNARRWVPSFLRPILGRVRSAWLGSFRSPR